MRFYPQPIVLLCKGATATLSAHRHIYLSVNANAILASIQGPRFLTPRDNPEPPSYSHRGVL